MLRKIRKWLADKIEHRKDLATCKTYWDKDIKVICDTLAYWEDSAHRWIPFIKGMSYSWGNPMTNMSAKSMSVTVVDGFGINNLLFTLVFYDASGRGNIRVYPLLVFCSHKRGVWTQPVHSEASLVALVGEKQFVYIRRNSRINWNMVKIV